MSISIDEVKHVATLSRISFSQQELAEYASQMEKIIGFIEQLKELNVEGVVPTTHVFPLKNIFRADDPHKSLSNEIVLRTAPQSENRFFKVPKVIQEK